MNYASHLPTASLAPQPIPPPSRSQLHIPCLVSNLYPITHQCTNIQTENHHSPLGYRCIAYMHAAGIKRVFWTNATGQWEGGKVRDFIDQMDRPVVSVADDGDTAAAAAVYVTKAEVVLMKGLQRY